MSRTLGEIVCWAQRRLGEAGIEGARQEARWLVAGLMDIEPGELIARDRDEAPAGFAAQLDALLKRRAEGEPLAHLIGNTEFYGRIFKTDARALIPRDDSECVVELALEQMPSDEAPSIADLGTGSGCLLISLLAAHPWAKGTGVDLSADALSLARENAVLNSVGGRANFIKGGWSDWQGWSEADLIISNPPYIASDIIETLDRDVRDYEPRLALDGGPDGLAAYREIIALGAEKMKPGAWLVLEIGYDQKAAVTALLEATDWTGILHRKDLGGNDRAIAAQRPVG